MHCESCASVARPPACAGRWALPIETRCRRESGRCRVALLIRLRVPQRSLQHGDLRPQLL